MAFELKEFENKLWNLADELRTNSSLKYNEFSTHVLNLIFFKFADYRFQKAKQKIESMKASSHRAFDEKNTYQARGVLHIPFMLKI